MGPLRDLTTKALAPKNFNDQTPMSLPLVNRGKWFFSPAEGGENLDTYDVISDIFPAAKGGRPKIWSTAPYQGGV